MKIRRVVPHNGKKAFEVYTYNNTYLFPSAVVRPTPRKGRWVVNAYVDPELDNEGFVYVLASGDEGTAHIDHVLEYNRDPSYMADMLLYEFCCCPDVRENAVGSIPCVRWPVYQVAFAMGIVQFAVLGIRKSQPDPAATARSPESPAAVMDTSRTDSPRVSFSDSLSQHSILNVFSPVDSL